MPTPDSYEGYDSSEIPHGKHLTFVDHIHAAFQPAENQIPFLKERARQRKDEYEAQKRLNDDN